MSCEGNSHTWLPGGDMVTAGRIWKTEVAKSVIRAIPMTNSGIAARIRVIQVIAWSRL